MPRHPRLSAATLLLAACTPQSDRIASAAPADTAAVRQAIESANSRFLDALQRGDSAGATANYADDAVLMMPNEPAWRRKAAVASGLRDFMSSMAIKDAKTTTESVIVSGDYAIETGAYQWTLVPKKGATITDKGKYLTAWRRQADGSWKIIRDINNSDLPGR